MNGLSKYVISFLTVFVILQIVESVAAQSLLQKKVDSIFVIASSGELRYRDLVQPAIDSLAALGTGAVPLLVDKFITYSARERLTIINILKKIGSPAVPHLTASLGRPEPLVVARICWALGDIGDPAAIQPLVDVCGHSSWWVREKAIDGLGKIGDTGGGETVLQSLDDSVGQVRKAAVVAAGRLKLTTGIERLVFALGDNFYGARLSAIDVLGKMDTCRVLEVLADSISSENSLIGNNGCRVLGNMGTDAALEILLTQTESDQADRRGHAAVALISADPFDLCGYRQRIIESETDRLTLLKIQSAIRKTRDDQGKTP